MTDKIRAKIVYFFPSEFIGEYSSYSEEPAVFSGATDWEEITQEELRILQSGKVQGPNGQTVVVLVEPNPEDKRFVMKTVRENIQKAKEKIAEDLEKERLKTLSKIAREQAKAETQRKKDLKKLEELKQKLGV